MLRANMIIREHLCPGSRPDQEQFNALFRGEEVELPKYDFQSGKSKKSGNR